MDPASASVARTLATTVARGVDPAGVAAAEAAVCSSVHRQHDCYCHYYVVCGTLLWRRGAVRSCAPASSQGVACQTGRASRCPVGGGRISAPALEGAWAAVGLEAGMCDMGVGCAEYVGCADFGAKGG